MKASLSATGLEAALTKARHMADGASSISYLGVRLCAEEGHIVATGTDGENTITGYAPGKVEEEGSVVILARPLLDWLRSAGKSTEIHLEASGEGELLASAGGGVAYRFRTLGTGFAPPAGAGTKGVPITLSTLSSAVSAVRASVGETGMVLLESDEQDLRLCTTDTYRISQAVVLGGGWGIFSGLVPLRTLERVASDHIDTVAVDARGRVVEFTGPGGRYSIRLSPLPFPPVGPHLGVTPPHQGSVDLSELRVALARLATIAEGEPLRCHLDKGELILEVTSPIGEGEEHVAALGEGDVVFSVNLEYLKAALNERTGTSVLFGWSGSMEPIYLSSSEPLPITTIVMPVRTPGH